MGVTLKTAIYTLRAMWTPMPHWQLRQPRQMNSCSTAKRCVARSVTVTQFEIVSLTGS
jgi:hypothetical protein